VGACSSYPITQAQHACTGRAYARTALASRDTPAAVSCDLTATAYRAGVGGAATCLASLLAHLTEYIRAITLLYVIMSRTIDIRELVRACMYAQLRVSVINGAGHGVFDTSRLVHCHARNSMPCASQPPSCRPRLERDPCLADRQTWWQV